MQVFVDELVVIRRPAATVQSHLLDRLSTLSGFGTAAYRHGEELRSKVGPVRPLAKEVLLGIGLPRLERDGLRLPVIWRATGANMLFPRLEGQLIVAPIDEGSSSLRLRGSYQPPFGWIGDVANRLLLARFAQLTVREWLVRVGEAAEAGCRREDAVDAAVQ